MTKVRTLSQTRPLEKNKFGKKGRKGRTSVMGGKYDQDHWPNVMRGTVFSFIFYRFIKGAFWTNIDEKQPIFEPDLSLF